MVGRSRCCFSFVISSTSTSAASSSSSSSASSAASSAASKSAAASNSFSRVVNFNNPKKISCSSPSPLKIA
jgi:hypothetical protein